MSMPAPAPVSTSTSWPRWTNSRTEPGTSPTRYSCVLTSLGTPIRIRRLLSQVPDVTRLSSPCGTPPPGGSDWAQMFLARLGALHHSSRLSRVPRFRLLRLHTTFHFQANEA